MKEESSRRAELEAGLSRSRRALPVQAVIAVVVLAMLGGIRVWLHWPIWIVVLGAVLGVAGLVGDTINVLYARRKLRRLAGSSSSR
jgi:protein-S-isoprenylcysteine O-methyltransferase Ste14